MSVYSQQCTFTGNSTLTGATNGWDVVYAVTFDTINADLAIRQPWKMDLGDGSAKFTQQDQGGNILEGAEVISLSVPPGGQGQIFLFKLEISSATLIPSDTTMSAIALKNVVATIETTLTFQADQKIKGLHNLIVNTAAPFNVTSVIGKNALDNSDLGGIEQFLLSDIISAFCTNFKELFTGVYANVFTKDYAESVNIPWLQPAGFSYAVATTDSGQGILAVLGSLSGNMTGLTQQVTPLLFPTNANVNAALAISSSTVANSTLLESLNSVVSQSTIGTLVPAKSGQVLSNQNEISAFYAVDLASGSVSFIINPATASATATTYPVTIPAGAITISVTDDSITTAITGAVVQLYGGYTQKITITSPYQLVVDSPSQNVDIIMSGAPVIQSEVIAPKVSTGAIAAEVGSVALGILAGEAIPFVIDKVTGYFTNVGATPANLYVPTLRFMAAERQMRATLQPVTFEIGAGREITLRPTADTAGKGEALKTQYLNAVTLNPTYPETPPPGAAPASIEMTNPNVSQVAPLNPRAPGINDSGLSELPEQPEADAPESLADDISGKVFQMVWNSISEVPAALNALETMISNAGLPNLGSLFGDGVLNDGKTLGVNDLRGVMSTYRQRAALYSGTIKYVIAATRNGTLSGGIYGQLISQIPESTQDSNTAAAVQRLSGITGINDAPGVKGLYISTNPGGDLTGTLPGLFSDFASAANTGNTDLSRFLIHQIIREAPRPLGVQLLAIAAYLGGVILGAAGGYVADKFISNLGSSGDENQSNDVASDIAQAAKSNPTSLLFSSVSFPFMERFVSGGVTGPAPASVLQCASVNGGLICGVQIPTNLN